MEIFDAIHTRRSIRQYKHGKVSDENIQKILEAAMTAPSARNKQHWHFIVIKNKQALNEISGKSPSVTMIANADCAILVCSDQSIEGAHDYWQQDLGACVQNMLLAIHALGLGAVWTAAYPKNEEYVNWVKERFDLPEEVMPFAIIPIGIPAQPSVKQDRFKKERIHQEKW